jgi:uncharacterized Zn finger protein
MSPSDRFWRDFYPPSARKRPPPEHGIKVKKFGSTWWGQRWITALEEMGGDYAARLGRGRSYARQGRVHDLGVKRGAVAARVTGSRATPYVVRLRLATLDRLGWTRAIEAMAAKARFAALLLAGEMPRDIDEAFGQAGVSLFPRSDTDLATSCTCPDWANPCKHVAAVHYVLGEAFDGNPFLLFELRGRDKDAVLASLRRLRAAADEPGRHPRAPRATGERARTVRLAGQAREGYESLRAPVDTVRFHISEPAVPGAILRQLGTPPSWRKDVPPHQLLQPTVSRAAALARELALGKLPAEPSAGRRPKR